MAITNGVLHWTLDLLIPKAISPGTGASDPITLVSVAALQLFVSLAAIRVVVFVSLTG